MPTFSVKELTEICIKIIREMGADEETANIVANNLVKANLTGHDSHGVIYIPRLLERIPDKINPKAKPVIKKDSGNIVLVDGKWAFGQVTAKYAMNLAIEKGIKNGLSMVGTFNSNHIGRLGEYALMAAEKGLIGFITVNSDSKVVPWNGLEKRIGTNPICYSIPRESSKPILLDMATSIVAGGKIRLKINTGEQVEDGWILDKNGNPSNDPLDYVSDGSILPFGGYKGYGLGLIVDVLAGILTGMGGSDKLQAKANGILIMTIRPDVFITRSQFEQNLTDLVNHIRNTPTASKNDRILLPGEPEYISEEKGRREGIFIDEKTWDDIKEVMRKLKIE